MSSQPRRTVRVTVRRHPRAERVALLAATVVLSACASLNKKEQGALIGAGVGSAVGAVIGNQTGSTARGAIIGAVVGGAAGTIIGHQMDQQAKELKQNIAGRQPERWFHHAGCRRWFTVERDTTTNEIHGLA